MKRKVLVDTGPLVAFLNQRDKYHAWALSQLAQIKPPTYTCEAVISEACFLLRSTREGCRGILRAIDRGLLHVDFRLQSEVTRVEQLLARYADVPMSLADGCLVRLAELKTGSAILTLDKDFQIYRMNGRQVIPTIMPRA